MKRLAMGRWIYFLVLYLLDLIRANVRLARDIVSPSPLFSPALRLVKVRPMGDGQLLLLANLISMTPGTLTVDVSDDRRSLLVHSLYKGSGEELEEVFLPRFYELILGDTHDE